MCVCSKSLHSCKKKNKTRDVLLHRKSPRVWAWIACCFHKLLRTKVTENISVNWAFAKLAKLHLERPLMLSLAYIYIYDPPGNSSFNKNILCVLYACRLDICGFSRGYEKHVCPILQTP